MQLTLATYNIHSGIGTDRRFDLQRVADVLRETGADLIALQEVGDLHGRTGAGDHPEDLAALLGFHMAYGPNVVREGRRYGNAILSRLPIAKSRNYDLSVHRGREPRGALRSDIDVGEGRLLHLFNLHLGLKLSERRKQESLLLTADILRDAIRQDPVIVCGDFNHWWNAPVHSLARNAIHDAAHLLKAAARTYPSRWPVLRLDRVFVDGGVRPLSLRAHRTPASALASDHLPLVMTFETVRQEPVAARHPVQVVA